MRYLMLLVLLYLALFGAFQTLRLGYHWIVYKLKKMFEKEAFDGSGIIKTNRKR